MGFKGLSSTAGAHGAQSGQSGKGTQATEETEATITRGNCAGLAVGTMRAEIARDWL